MLHADGDHEWTVVGSGVGDGQCEPSREPPLTQSSTSGPAATPAAAQFQVLHTPELLESILASCGDMRAVLLAQRVSRFWRDVIRDSSLLQCMLFFEAVPPFAPDEGLSPEELRAGFAINPLLRHHFPHWLQYHGHWPRRAGPPSSCVSEFGAVVFAPPAGGDEREVADAEEATGDDGRYRFEEDSDDPRDRPDRPLFPPARHDAFTRAGASWRRMLVCQPASRGLAFRIRPYDPGEWRDVPGLLAPAACETDEDEENQRRRQQQHSGLRMGLLYDATLQMYWRRYALHLDGTGELTAPSCFNLYWVPPGCAGLWPFHAHQLNFGPSVAGLGVTVFAVLEEDPMPHPMNRRQRPPIVFAEPSRCEEHVDYHLPRFVGSRLD